MDASNDDELARLQEDARRLYTSVSGRSQPMTAALAQITAEASKLAQKGAYAGAMGRGPIILARQGIDVGELAQSVSVDLTQALEPLEAVRDTDVEAHIQQEQQLTIVTAFEEGIRETLRDFEARALRTVELDWERSKRRIMEELGQAGQALEMDAQAHAAADDASSTAMEVMPLTLPASREMSARMVSYAVAVARLNVARASGTTLQLCRELSETVRRMDARSSTVSELFDLLSQVVEESTGSARKFADSYALVKTGPRAEATRRQLVAHTRRYLEQQYRLFMERRIAGAPRTAQLGGEPGIEHKVHAYLRIWVDRYGGKQQTQKEGDVPVWGYIYFLLRCGEVRKAADAMSTFSAFFATHDPHFPDLMRAYESSPDRTLSRQDLLRAAEYYARAAHNNDVFRQAVYRVIARTELKRDAEPYVIQAIEDYLWMQLCLVREGDEALPGGGYSLYEMQATVLRPGPDHYTDKGARPLKYAQVLFLSAQFERAIDFLDRFESYRVDAVHLAIALHYYGLLRIAPPNPNRHELLVDANGSTPALDFGLLLQRYVQRSRRDDPELALHYILLHTLDMDSATQSYCSEQIQALLLSHPRQLLMFLGDGSSTGLLNRFAPLLGQRGNVSKEIAQKAAQRCEADGSLGLAMDLYKIAQMPNKMFKLATRRLCQAMPQGDATLTKETQQLLEYYRTPSAERDAVNSALQLQQVQDLARAGRSDEALQSLSGLGILPLAETTMVATGQAATDALAEELAAQFPAIVQLASELIYRSFVRVRDSNDPRKAGSIAELRRKSERLVKFVGSQQKPLPQDVCARLLQNDALMK